MDADKAAGAPALTQSQRESFYSRIYLIRIVEERILELFEQGRLSGTTHTYVGQEAIAVAAVSHLGPRDLIFSSHRCHGHFLARFGDPVPLLAELMGREGGASGGRGGSQNLCGDSFFSSGVQGGYMPIATGMALAEKIRGSGSIVTAFIGDGTMGEGALYEALNMASLWKVPLLVVVENNRYAQTTPIELNLAGSITGRAAAFGIPAEEIESNDVARLHPFFGAAVFAVRAGGGPRMAVVHTYRLRAHSKGDDDRSEAEIEAWRRKDPLIDAARGLDAARVKVLEEEARLLLAGAEREVERMAPARMEGRAGAGCSIPERA